MHIVCWEVGFLFTLIQLFRFSNKPPKKLRAVDMVRPTGSCCG